MSSSDYRIARFAKRGRGLEAVRAIPSGKVIISTPCVVVPRNEIYGTLAQYIFKWENPADGSGERHQVALALGDASLINHASPGNCEYDPDFGETTITVKTRRAIEPGEELTIDYGWRQPDFVAIGPASDGGEAERRHDWLRLAQSLRDTGRTAEAAEAYGKRAEMEGSQEEAWFARLQQARCLRAVGDEGGFVRQALAAFNQRPERAEPLYDLARYYRERGMNAASLLFSEAGLAIPRPEQEVLVPEDFIYTSGLREEFAIAAYYAADPEQKKRGHAVCDELAIDRAVPTGSRNLARSNLLFYTEPANAMMPSFAAQPVSLSVPCGYRPGNPSVACWGEEVVVAQSLVPIGTCPPRNFLLRLGDRLEIRSKIEISMPEIPVTEWRPFAWRGGLWYCAAERTTTMARIDDRETGHWRFADWRSLPCADGRNWLPVVGGEGLRLVAIGDPIRIMDERSEMISEVKPAFAAEHFTGSSQIIALDGGWLAVVCDIIKQSPDTQVECRHRFVWLDETWAMRAVSRAFFFRRKGAEFAAGLAWHPDERRLLVSWGDGEPWIATIEAADIRKALIVQ